MRDNADSKFIKVGNRPARFFLKQRKAELPPDAVTKLEKEEGKKAEKKTPYHERDLHPLLTYFAYANPSFNRGRSIFTKTILHEKSTKSGYSEWIHPDMVGFYLPLDDWRPDVIEFNRLSDNNSLRLFSFEIKKSLTKGNYREAYFQAVSNSSWRTKATLSRRTSFRTTTFSPKWKGSRHLLESESFISTWKTSTIPAYCILRDFATLSTGRQSISYATRIRISRSSFKT